MLKMPGKKGKKPVQAGHAKAAVLEAHGLDGNDPACHAIGIVAGLIRQHPEPFVHSPWPREEP